MVIEKLVLCLIDENVSFLTQVVHIDAWIPLLSQEYLIETWHALQSLTSSVNGHVVWFVECRGDDEDRRACTSLLSPLSHLPPPTSSPPSSAAAGEPIWDPGVFNIIIIFFPHWWLSYNKLFYLSANPTCLKDRNICTINKHLSTVPSISRPSKPHAQCERKCKWQLSSPPSMPRPCWRSWCTRSGRDKVLRGRLLHMIPRNSHCIFTQFPACWAPAFVAYARHILYRESCDDVLCWNAISSRLSACLENKEASSSVVRESTLVNVQSALILLADFLQLYERARCSTYQKKKREKRRNLNWKPLPADFFNLLTERCRKVVLSPEICSKIRQRDLRNCP